MITAIALSLTAAGLFIWSGLGSSRLVASVLMQRLCLLLSIVAAVVSAGVVFEATAPRDASASASLMKTGDSLSLESEAAGVLNIECRTLEGIKEEGKALLTTLEVTGKAGVQRFDDRFQIGQSTDEYKNPTEAIKTTSHRISTPGEGAQVSLKKLSKSGVVAVHLEYFPEHLPFHIGMIAMFVITGLAASYEGAAPQGWQRTFLTVVSSTLTAFIWLVQDGLTTADSIWTVWIRVAYSIMVGAFIGTFLPGIVGRFLPEMQAPERKDIPTSDTAA